MDPIDLSYKDRKYFIDEAVYNCPFCNRRNIRYRISDSFDFWWTREKKCYGYIVRCSDCEYESMHLSFYELALGQSGGFVRPACQVIHKTDERTGRSLQESDIQLKNDDGSPMEIDDAIFHKQPTSYFTIDKRIHESIRLPLNEADNCRTSGFLTGGSACLRKAIYEFLKHQGIPSVNERRERLDYDGRLKLLKDKLPKEDEGYCDILKIIKGVTSNELHEGSWAEFNSSTLRLLIETTKVILYSVYVEPDEKQKTRGVIQRLQEMVSGSKTKKEDSKTTKQAAEAGDTTAATSDQ